MQNNTHIASNASTAHIIMPQKGEKITTNPYIELNEVIIKAHDNCISFYERGILCDMFNVVEVCVNVGLTN